MDSSYTPGQKMTPTPPQPVPNNPANTHASSGIPKNILFLFFGLFLILFTFGGFILGSQFGSSNGGTILLPSPDPDILPTGSENGVACTLDALECPDGSFVGRTPPSCEFAPCPNTSQANWKTATVHKLSFKTPPTWWVSKPEILQDGRQTSLIDPIELFISGPGDSPSAYMIDFSPTLTVAEQKQNLIQGFPITVEKEEAIKVSSVTGVKIQGKAPIGPLAGKDITVVIFPGSNGTYYFSDAGTIENHTQYFNQILTTFTINN